MRWRGPPTAMALTGMALSIAAWVVALPAAVLCTAMAARREDVALE